MNTFSEYKKYLKEIYIYFFFFINKINLTMRMHIKNKKKIFKRRRQIILLIILALFIYLFIKVSDNISYYYMNYSKKEAKQIIEESIGNALTDEVLESIKDKEIFMLTKNDENEIEMIDYNTYEVNMFLRTITDNISNTLKREEKNTEKIAFYIPLGSITQNPIFNSKGPKIPVRIEVIGSVLSSVKTKVTEYGINNCLIEMFVSVEVTEKVILPVMTDTIKVSNEIPISYKIIKGKIPTYYGNSLDKTSSIYSLPMEQ